jgi:RNA polymerase sigma-70 factor (ECF subfamily)
VAISQAELVAAYERLEGPLYNVLYRWLWNAEDCQDLMHDAFLRVWDRRATSRVHELDALIWTTALNLAKNRLRWRSLWRFAVPADEAIERCEEPPATAARRQREARLRHALDALDRDSRNLVLLSECAGLDGGELQSIFGWPAGTLASRKHRALARLRELLGPDGLEEEW